MRKKSKNDDLRRFGEQREAKVLAESALSSHFEMQSEVELRSPAGDKFRIDAVAICPTAGYIVGLEYKASFLFTREFADSLRQAINYRDCEIVDKRLPVYLGRRLDCCLVFPDWDGLHEDNTLLYVREAEGMRLLAQHFRVGVLRENTNLSFSMVIGPSNSGGVWHSASGWTKNALGVLRGKRRRGSATKAYDPAKREFDLREAAKARPIGPL